jgi:hypothetical protein
MSLSDSESDRRPRKRCERSETMCLAGALVIVKASTGGQQSPVSGGVFYLKPSKSTIK